MVVLMFVVMVVVVTKPLPVLVVLMVVWLDVALVTARRGGHMVFQPVQYMLPRASPSPLLPEAEQRAPPRRGILREARCNLNLGSI